MKTEKNEITMKVRNKTGMSLTTCKRFVDFCEGDYVQTIELIQQYNDYMMRKRHAISEVEFLRMQRILTPNQMSLLNVEGYSIKKIFHFKETYFIIVRCISDFNQIVETPYPNKDIPMRFSTYDKAKKYIEFILKKGAKK